MRKEIVRVHRADMVTRNRMRKARNKRKKLRQSQRINKPDISLSELNRIRAGYAANKHDLKNPHPDAVAKAKRSTAQPPASTIVKL